MIPNMITLTAEDNLLETKESSPEIMTDKEDISKKMELQTKGLKKTETIPNMITLTVEDNQ